MTPLPLDSSLAEKQVTEEMPTRICNQSCRDGHGEQDRGAFLNGTIISAPS